MSINKPGGSGGAGAPGVGLDQGQVDARVLANVADWAEHANTDAIPATKLTNAPTSAAQPASIFVGQALPSNLSDLGINAFYLVGASPPSALAGHAHSVVYKPDTTTYSYPTIRTGDLFVLHDGDLTSNSDRPDAITGLKIYEGLDENNVNQGWVDVTWPSATIAGAGGSGTAPASWAEAGNPDRLPATKLPSGHDLSNLFIGQDIPANPDDMTNDVWYLLGATVHANFTGHEHELVYTRDTGATYHYHSPNFGDLCFLHNNDLTSIPPGPRNISNIKMFADFTDYWVEVGMPGFLRWHGAWAAGTYQRGDIVSHSSKNWVLLSVATTTTEPGETSHQWDELTAVGAGGGISEAVAVALIATWARAADTETDVPVDKIPATIARVAQLPNVRIEFVGGHFPALADAESNVLYTNGYEIRERIVTHTGDTVTWADLATSHFDGTDWGTYLGEHASSSAPTADDTRPESYWATDTNRFYRHDSGSDVWQQDPHSSFAGGTVRVFGLETDLGVTVGRLYALLLSYTTDAAALTAAQTAGLFTSRYFLSEVGDNLITAEVNGNLRVITEAEYTSSQTTYGWHTLVPELSIHWDGAWSSGTYTRGSVVSHSNRFWMLVGAASTNTTPGASSHQWTEIGGAPGTTVEEVRDTVAAFIRGTDGISVTHSDPADTLTIGYTPPDTVSPDVGVSGRAIPKLLYNSTAGAELGVSSSSLVQLAVNDDPDNYEVLLIDVKAAGLPRKIYPVMREGAAWPSVETAGVGILIFDTVSNTGGTNLWSPNPTRLNIRKGGGSAGWAGIRAYIYNVWGMAKVDDWLSFPSGTSHAHVKGADIVLGGNTNGEAAGTVTDATPALLGYTTDITSLTISHVSGTTVNLVLVYTTRAPAAERAAGITFLDERWLFSTATVAAVEATETGIVTITSTWAVPAGIADSASAVNGLRSTTSRVLNWLVATATAVQEARLPNTRERATDGIAKWNATLGRWEPADLAVSGDTGEQQLDVGTYTRGVYEITSGTILNVLPTDGNRYDGSLGSVPIMNRYSTQRILKTAIEKITFQVRVQNRFDIFLDIPREVIDAVGYTNAESWQSTWHASNNNIVPAIFVEWLHSTGSQNRGMPLARPNYFHVNAARNADVSSFLLFFRHHASNDVDIHGIGVISMSNSSLTIVKSHVVYNSAVNYTPA